MVMKAGLPVFQSDHRLPESFPRTVYTWPCQGMVFWHSPAHVLGEVLDRLYGSYLTIGMV